MNNDRTWPLVSVLIPLYNHEQFIEQTLESIVGDSYPNKELIVIDDGSKDASFQRAKRWSEEYGRSFSGRFEVLTRENRGVSATLNELLALSHGDYIAYVSSDDYLLPDGIATRLEYLERNLDKMLVVGDYITVDFEGKILNKSGIEELFEGSRKRLINNRLLSYEMIFNWCLAGPVYMGRRELYERIGGYDESLAVEDWDFCLKLLPNEWLGFVDYTVAAYRLRPAEASMGHTVQQRIRFDEAMQRTVTNNLPAFKGIKRAYLFFQKMKYYGILERLHGRDSLMAFLARKTGRVMVVLLKACYELWARCIVTVTPKR
jgi:glycosyltransferase involved in cell wall biosynthesis